MPKLSVFEIRIYTLRHTHIHIYLHLYVHIHSFLFLEITYNTTNFRGLSMRNSKKEEMYREIEKLVRKEPARLLLHIQKFVFLHINTYTDGKSRFHFPAEITAAEFSLEKGLTRIFHTLVGLDQIKTNLQPFCMSDIKRHAEKKNKINPFSNFSIDYKTILLKLLSKYTQQLI